MLADSLSTRAQPWPRQLLQTLMTVPFRRIDHPFLCLFQLCFSLVMLCCSVEPPSLLVDCTVHVTVA